MATTFTSLEWWGDPVGLYCPACGRPIYALDWHGDEDVDFAPPKCPHVRFSYTEGFDYVAEDLVTLSEEVEAEVERLEESDDEGAEDIHPAELMLQKIASNSLLAMQITTCGVACGPVSNTIRVVLDFLAGQEKD
jgi:hypothetical protein